MRNESSSSTLIPPYGRLSLLYFFYFCELGVFVPFWTLYLARIGHDAGSIATIMAAMMVTRLAGSNVWGWLGDKCQRRLTLVRLALIAAALVFALQFTAVGKGALLLVLCLYSFFWNAVLPQIEVYTMQSLGKSSHYYGRVRLWGSVGFIVFVMLCGWLFDRIDLAWVPVIILALTCCVFCVSFTLNERPPVEFPDSVSLLPLVLNKKVISFLLIGLLMVVSHGPFYVFYSIFLEQHGYSKTLIGGLWSLGVIAEILIFLMMHRLIQRVGVNRLILLSLAIAVIRWLLIGQMADSILILIIAACMHAATYGIFHGACIHFIHSHFGAAHGGKGQSLYASISYGAGSALGAWYAGAAWLSLGPEACFYFAGLFNVLAMLIYLIGMRDY